MLWLQFGCTIRVCSRLWLGSEAELLPASEPLVPATAPAVTRSKGERFGRIMINTVTPDGTKAIALSSALALLRVNFSLSADRALRIINASKQRLSVLDDVPGDFISLGTNVAVAVAMDTGIEIGCVICIGALGKGRSSQIVACGAPVSLKEHPAGLLVWLKWFDRIPFASMTTANVAISD